ncbi:hypothetical protein [Inediibacterium massiliense]|uniref:hypothetical protein n=1 Tax=Inediibacterium massiliense TaxID=1658111 RepID=UPI0006B45F66|nr:hypothetical protein [Inediibacterium massiliense]
MINSIQERRVKVKNGYQLYLEIPEKEYLFAYDENISTENAKDLLNQYLEVHQDDGRLDHVEIKHDKNNHSVNIKASLIYEGNDHTKGKYIPSHLS